MNKNIIIIILTIGLLGIIFHKIAHIKRTAAQLKIGILQTASHPALDAAREGFIAVLKNHFGNSIDFVIQNAQGSLITAHIIAERYHADNSINAIYAIATPALQSIALLEKEKPIFISAITDPYAVGVIQDKTNICGVTDMVDIAHTVKAIKALLPHITTIALIYNPSENNSIIQIKLMKKELYKNDIKVIRIGVSMEAEIPQAITTALYKADALFTPTDNLIASTMPVICHLAHNAKKPLIACHNQAVEQGALMARGINYYDNGKQTAEIALKVLRDGQKPYNIAIVPTLSDTVVINKKVLEELNLTINKISDTIVYIH